MNPQYLPATASDDSSWAGKIKPGAAMTLYYIMTALYAASSKQWDTSMANDAGTAIAATKLGEWDNMQIVVNQR
jgi:hypothetical protein